MASGARVPVRIRARRFDPGAAGRRIPLTAGGTGLLAAGSALVALAYPLGSRPLLLGGAAALAFVAIAVLLVHRPVATGPVSVQLAQDRLTEGGAATVRVDAARACGRWLLAVPERLGGPRALSGSADYTLADAPRGAHQLGPVLARVTDPFGLAERRVVVAPPTELLVWPRVEHLLDRPGTRRSQDAPEQPRRTQRWSTGTDLVGAHPYQPTDDLRRVLWRVYARTGALHVQDSEQGLDDRLILVCDTGRDAGRTPEVLDVAARLAASVLGYFTGQGWDLVLRAGPYSVRGRGGAVRSAALDALARMQPGGPTVSALCQDLVAGRLRGHVVVVSAGLGADDVRVVQRLVSRGLSVLVVALLWDPDALAGSTGAAAAGARVVALRPDEDVGAVVRRAVLLGSGLAGAAR